MASPPRGPRQVIRSSVIPDSPTYSSFPVPRTIETSSSRRDFKDINNMASVQLQPVPGIPPGDPPAPPPPLPLPPIPSQAESHATHTQNEAATAAIRRAPSPVARKVPSTPSMEAYLHAVRDRSREQYQRLRERPSVPLLSTDATTLAIRSRSDSTRSAPSGPCISVVNGKGRNTIAGAPNVPTVPTRYGRVPTPVGCLPGAGSLRIEDWAIFGGPSEDRQRGEQEGCNSPSSSATYRKKRVSRDGSLLTGVRHKVKNMIKGLHVSVSVSFGEKGMVDEEVDAPRQTRKEMTLRIKNNKTGSCVFEMFVLAHPV
jgi:hypothetical protein